MAGFVSGSGLQGRARLDRAFCGQSTLEDGETVHNAFFDRDFREEQP
jgi:hypothetical protein